MLRFTPALAVLLVAASVSAQQAGAPQPGSPQRPAQTTGSQGADANQTQNRNNAQRPNANQGAQADPNQSVTPPRNDVPDRSNRQPVRPGNRQAQSGDSFDSHVADCLILSNQEEIALLKFGTERTKSDKVKELAQSMIKDHEKAISELRQFASPQHANESLTGFKEGDREVATTREARKVPADVADNSGGGENSFATKMHRMIKRAHEQCLVLNREELTKYEGHEFDQAFLGAQLGAHIGMLAHLKAAQEETSAELSQWTGKAQETTKKHKDHLEKLMNDLAKDAHSPKK
jgi:predicted outer membrane protein